MGLVRLSTPSVLAVFAVSLFSGLPAWAETKPKPSVPAPASHQQGGKQDDKAKTTEEKKPQDKKPESKKPETATEAAERAKKDRERALTR